MTEDNSTKNKKSERFPYLYDFACGALCGGSAALFFGKNFSYLEIAVLSPIAGFGIWAQNQNNTSKRENLEKGAYYTLGIMTGASTVKFLEHVIRQYYSIK